MRKDLLISALLVFGFSVIMTIILIWKMKTSIVMITLLDFFVIIASLSVYSYLLVLFAIIPFFIAILLLILGFAISDNPEKQQFMAKCKEEQKPDCKALWKAQEIKQKK